MNWRASKLTESNWWQSSQLWVRLCTRPTRQSSLSTSTWLDPRPSCRRPKSNSWRSSIDVTHNGPRKSDSAKIRTLSALTWPNSASKTKSRSVSARFRPMRLRIKSSPYLSKRLRLSARNSQRCRGLARSKTWATPRSWASSRENFTASRPKSRSRNKN